MDLSILTGTPIAREDWEPLLTRQEKERLALMSDWWYTLQWAQTHGIHRATATRQMHELVFKGAVIIVGEKGGAPVYRKQEAPEPEWDSIPYPDHFLGRRTGPGKESLAALEKVPEKFTTGQFRKAGNFLSPEAAGIRLGTLVRDGYVVREGAARLGQRAWFVKTNKGE
jgi:hypothetical protein